MWSAQTRPNFPAIVFFGDWRMTLRLAFWLSLISVTSLVGCRDTSKRLPVPTEVSLKAVAVAYGSYLRTHQGKGPANETDFRNYVQKMADAERQQLGITDVSKFLQSPNDEQAYVVRYAFTPPPPGPSGVSWIAHEKAGKDGKRFVAFVTGQIREVDEAGFQEILKSNV